MRSAPHEDPAALIETEGDLERLCARLRGASFLALDTEFVRVRTYYPRLCLIQIAVPGLVACVDPLALEHLDPLMEVIFDEASTKVMHAARQDLEILHQLAGRLPQPLFDTQLAAGLLGLKEQVSYAELVQTMLGRSVDKSHTRTDWAQRPLTPEQLRYAEDDVRHLVDLYLELAGELQDRGRMEWAIADSGELLEPDLYEIDPALAWRRVKGARRLSGASLRALRRLAAWREREAVRCNRPRQWILRDDALVSLARAMPDSQGDLRRIAGIPQQIAARHGRQLLSCISEARESGDAGIERAPVRGPPPEEDKLRMLQALLRSRGKEQDISPTALATRSQLQRLLAGDRDVPVLRGWRLDVIGRELLDIVEQDSARGDLG